MRIIAGTKRGARIAAPKGLATRPTGDRVREAAFNLIGPVDDATVLDLFAGSGAMGLEALSRGAASAMFVESDRGGVPHDRGEPREAGADRRARPLRRRRLDAAAGVRARTTSCSSTRRTRLGRARAEARRQLPRVLAPDGLLVVETGARIEPELPLALRTSRRYGSARLTLFEHSMITAICPGSLRPRHVRPRRRDRARGGDLRPRRRRRRRQPAAQDAAVHPRRARRVPARGAPDLDNVEVDVFSELVVEFARRWEAKVIVKGLRVISDFEWEFQMNQLNRTSRRRSRPST